MERLEEWLPVYYAYNSVDRLKLPNLTQKPGWAVQTLRAILVSTPSALPDSTPDSSVHTTLYHLVESLRKGGETSQDPARPDRFQQFGILLDETVIPEILTNWFLLLVYKGDKLFFLTGEDLVNFYRHLKTMALRPNNDALVRALARLKSDPFMPNILAVIDPDVDSSDPDEDPKPTSLKM
ncbi:hypothetical protein [Massilia niabensis]|uniref:Uncharacterized protein n=1 Tax=Massilia niabensis TaxID=544910 RepID=A0ABW0L4Y5_9BURK